MKGDMVKKDHPKIRIASQCALPGIHRSGFYYQPYLESSIAAKEVTIYPYLLKDIEITKVNKVWATAITYVPMRKAFMYLCSHAPA